MFFILQQLDKWARHIVPVAISLLFLLLGIALTAVPGLSSIPPLLILIAVYYWSVHRPDLLPMSVLFLLGLITDALLRWPFGLSSLTYILVARLVQSQRPVFVDQSYAILWFGFAVVLCFTQILHWALMAIITQHWLAFTPLLLQGLFTLALFPILCWLLIFLQRHWVH